LASVRAVEDALGIQIPKNANYIRNIMLATLMVHDHLVHFYHLHALDWVSPVEALKADPVKTAEIQKAVLKWAEPFIGLAKDYTGIKAYARKFPNQPPLTSKRCRTKSSKL
jgi:hydrogenase large subunit